MKISAINVSRADGMWKWDEEVHLLPSLTHLSRDYEPLLAFLQERGWKIAAYEPTQKEFEEARKNYEKALEIFIEFNDRYYQEIVERSFKRLEERRD